MKRSAFLATIIALILCPLTAASEGETPRNTLSIDLFMPICSPIDYFIEGIWNVPLCVQYKHVVANHIVGVSRVGGFGFYSNGKWGALLEGALGVEWHPFREGIEGFHVDLCGLVNCEPKSEAYRYRIGVAPGFGWQFPMGHRMSLDFVAGGLGFAYTAMISPSSPGWGWGIIWGGGGIFLGLTF
jgi:hypothetical protein